MSPVETFCQSLLERAVLENASDVHIEPFERSFQLRLRTPRGLITLSSPQNSLFAPLVRHLKLLACLDIAVEALPQDGKFALDLGGGLVEFRLSVLPTLYGPSLVLRVLDATRTPKNIEALGFDPQTVAEIKKALSLPFGMVAVVGKTGSGKTTTLYACVRELLKEGRRKILSVEDPIEYTLAGVQQVAVSENLSFADALRAFLRHDPDVIFVGEIRDRETARLAIQAALTGHLVLTSVHTGTAEGLLTRLLDLGVERYLIDSALRFVLAQELHLVGENRHPTAHTLWHNSSTPKEALCGN